MWQHSLIHLANVAYLLSYTVRDIRILRWLTITGIVLVIPYFLCMGLYEPAAWNIVFLTINLWWLRKKDFRGNKMNNDPQATDEAQEAAEVQETEPKKQAVKPPMKTYPTLPETPAAKKERESK